MIAETTGAAPATIRPALQVLGLAVGVYRDTIVIIGDDAASTAATVPVELHVLGAGPAAHLLVVTEPSSAAQAGVAFPQQPVIQVADAQGNAASQSGVVVAATIASGGGTLGGTATVSTNGAGQAAFSNLSISGAVGPRTLRFSASGLASTSSGTVDVGTAPAAVMVANAGDKQTATVGSAVAVPPSVFVTDASGNPVAGVVVQFAVTGGGGSVAPTAVTTTASGLAAPSSWTLGTVAGPNSLSAAVTGLSGSPVTFGATGTPGPPSLTQSVISATPATIVASTGANPATIVVTVRDGYGNPVSGASVALSASGAGTTISQPPGTTGSNGTASGSLSATQAGAKVVSATVSGAGTIAQTVSVTVVGGPAAALTFTVQPTDTRANSVITPAVQVSAQDAFGNVATSFTGLVTMSVSPGTGTPLATLSGTLTVGAVGGTATFSNLSIDLPSTSASPYRLSATATSITGATSASFNVTP